MTRQERRKLERQTTKTNKYPKGKTMKNLREVALPRIKQHGEKGVAETATRIPSQAQDEKAPLAATVKKTVKQAQTPERIAFEKKVRSILAKASHSQMNIIGTLYPRFGSIQLGCQY